MVCIYVLIARVPFVIYVGFMSSSPRPNLFKYVFATYTES